MSHLATVDLALLLGSCIVTAAAGMFVWPSVRAPGTRAPALLPLDSSARYRRRCVGWSLRDDLTAELLVDALGMAMSARRPAAGLARHSGAASITPPTG